MFSGNIIRCFNIRTLRVDRNHSASRSLQNVVRGGGQADELCLEFPGANLPRPVVICRFWVFYAPFPRCHLF
jgi:hypothetical protein